MHRRLLVFLLLLGLTPALAQHEAHAGHKDHAKNSDSDNVGWVPRDILERPLPLREGIGRAHEAVSTSSKEAQAYYDQGLAYLHSYVWIEAARSFNQALRNDPKLAMAYIGLSRAYSGLEDQPAAGAALEKARANAAGAKDWERRRIELRAKQLDCINDIANPGKHQAYKDALDAALAIDINDPELWLLRGNAEEPTGAGRGQEGGAASVAIYERVLKLSPDNFAAHHYLIHTYETLGRPEDAVHEGADYARLTPNVAHGQHMYGHDLAKVGRTDEAIAQFRKADDLERAYYASEKISPHLDWHHIHNLDLMAVSMQYQGRMKEAEKVWTEAFAVPAVDMLWEWYKGKFPEFLMTRGKYSEALAASQELIAGQWPLGRATGHSYAARVHLAMKHVDEAKKELAAAEAELAKTPETSPEPLLAQPRAALALQMAALKAEMAMHTGSPEATAQLKGVVNNLFQGYHHGDAVAALFHMQYIAAEAREAGNWEAAEYTAKRMIEFDAKYAGGHYAMAWVAGHKGDMAAARSEFQTAHDFWPKADADFYEMSQVRQRLSAMHPGQ